FVDQFIETDMGFHLKLAEATHNPIYPILIQSFYNMTEKLSFNITKYSNRPLEINRKAQGHHWKMIMAIKDRDEYKAILSTKEHISGFRDDVDDLIKRNI